MFDIEKKAADSIAMMKVQNDEFNEWMGGSANRLHFLISWSTHQLNMGSTILEDVYSNTPFADFLTPEIQDRMFDAIVALTHALSCTQTIPKLLDEERLEVPNDSYIQGIASSNLEKERAVLHAFNNAQVLYHNGLPHTEPQLWESMLETRRNYEQLFLSRWEVD